MGMDLKLSVVFFFSIILYIRAKQDFTNSNVNVKRKAVNEWSNWEGSAIGSGVFQVLPFTDSDKPLKKPTKPLVNAIPVKKPLLIAEKRPVVVIKKKPLLAVKKPLPVVVKKPLPVVVK